PYAVRGLVNYFRDELDTHIEAKRDPAQAAPGLIRYLVTDPQSAALREAQGFCPTAAIVERPREDHASEADEAGEAGEADTAEAGAPDLTIDDARCIRCDVCREIAPDAVRVEDRFLELLSVV
ncbi:MAG: hypothetical protein OXH38_11020, partial [Chloroflexi bacterium]|nr:hypothetical protein [Chloroflexota bacterium]